MVDTVNNVFVQQFCDTICNFFGIMALVLTIGQADSLLLQQHSTGYLRSPCNKIASKYSNYRVLFNNFKVSGLLSIRYGTLGLTVDKDLLATAPTALYGVFAELLQQNSFKILKLMVFVQ